jgi:hypothetical protein
MDVLRQGCPRDSESGRANRLRPFPCRSGRHPVPSLHTVRASNGRGLFRPGPGKTRRGPPGPLPAPLIPLRLFPAPAHPSCSCFVASATRAYYCVFSFPRTVLGSAPCRSRFVAILSFRIFSVRILIFVFRIDRKRIKNFFIVYIPVYIPYIYFFSFCLLVESKQKTNKTHTKRKLAWHTILRARFIFLCLCHVNMRELVIKG